MSYPKRDYLDQKGFEFEVGMLREILEANNARMLRWTKMLSKSEAKRVQLELENSELKKKVEALENEREE